MDAVIHGETLVLGNPRTWLIVLALLFCTGCVDNPERVLVGRWTVTTAASPQAAEWVFHEDGLLEIHREGATPMRAHWRLLGRGHVLAVEPEDARNKQEIYDVTSLSDDSMALRREVDMEVRIQGRLGFRRLAAKVSDVVTR